MDKVYCIQTMGYYKMLKNHVSSNYEGNVKCLLLSERSQPEKITYCIISTTGHSEKGKIMKMIF